MKKYSYIISEHCPDRTIPPIPIAIFHGDSKEEAVKNIIRIIAKYLAKGDFSLVQEKETLVIQNKALIAEFIRKDLEGGSFYGDTLICIEPLYIDHTTLDIFTEEYSRQYRHVIFDENSSRFYDESEFSGIDECKDDSYLDCITDDDEVLERQPYENSYYVDLVTNGAYDSPFLYKSPFILRGKTVYAVDSKTGLETGPYIKVEEFGSIFVVHTEDKVGVLTSKGSVMLDCIYDGVYPQWRHIQLIKDGKMGLYSCYGNVLIPCEYDEFQFPETPNDPVIATKGTRKGYIAVDGSFHPVDEETEDFSDLDPTLDYI